LSLGSRVDSGDHRFFFQLELSVVGGACLKVRATKARPVNVRLERPIRTAVGTIPSAPLVLIDVLTEEGVTGKAYLFAYTPLVLAPLARLIEEIGGELSGKSIAPFDRMREFNRRFRLLGWQGLVGMAVSGLDMAFWDALGKAAGWPVVRLLGGEPRPIMAYDSFGVLDLKADEPAIARSVENGFRGIKIKIGDGSPERDLATVVQVRKLIGAGVALMVDYNQSLTPTEARNRIERLAEYDILWVEEPVPAEDVEGHARVRAGSPVRIQTGENWWFPRDMAKSIAAGASDFAMLDIMKIGGVTGWLSAMGQAEAASLPVSSHIFVEASAHMLAVTPTAHWLEYLDIAGSILAEKPRIVDGSLMAAGPGLGLSWDEDAVTRYAM
jgi:mandelate racemase